MNALAAAISGVLFGIGLVLSGMTNPAKVLNFLDVAGHWDPSLAFVMLGAVAVTAVGYAVGRRRQRPRFAAAFPKLPSRGLDGWLLGGAALFGLGWGLAGFCPGPAIANLGTGSMAVFGFVLAMLAGMALGNQMRGG